MRESLRQTERETTGTMRKEARERKRDRQVRKKRYLDTHRSQWETEIPQTEKKRVREGEREREKQNDFEKERESKRESATKSQKEKDSQTFWIVKKRHLEKERLSKGDFIVSKKDRQTTRGERVRLWERKRERLCE